MFFRCSHILWILILCEAVSGDNVMKAVNNDIAFTPVSGSVSPRTTSITWKHRDNAGVVVKVIEWDREEDITDIPNPKFRSHASLDKHTGELTLRYLQLTHTGVYTIDINSKEQRKQFSLTVIEPVHKPYIRKECVLGDIPVCSLSCGDDDGASESTVVWKNSAGETLYGRDRYTRTLTMTKTGNPEQAYICTLKGAVNEETSDPVYERDLFYDSNTVSVIIAIVVSVIAGVVFLILLLILIIRCLRRHTRIQTQNQSSFQFTSLSSLWS
ncbi:hypothetical protein R3I94_004815 [Phoxinus phoxinus]